MLAVTLGNNCLWSDSLARTACASVGVCEADRGRWRSSGEECVSIFSPGASADACARGRVGCRSIIRCVWIHAPSFISGPKALCLCVFLSASGVCTCLSRVCRKLPWWRGYASELMFPFGPEYDRVCIFQSAAIRSLCRLPPRYHTRVCACVVFAEMDADFKPNFPSRRRASSSKTLLSGKYMYLRKKQAPLE